MIVIKDRVKQTATAIVATGDLSLVGTPSGYVSFASVLNSGEQVYYCVENGSAFEVGIGTYGASGTNTFRRDTILNSSTGSRLSVSGRATVFITVPASKFPFVTESGELSLALNTLNDVTLTAPASGESLKYNGSAWINEVISGYTTEEAQDAIGSILSDSSSISFSYNDAAPSISASVKNSGITDVMISGGIDATKIGSGNVSSAEFGYLDGVTSSIQNQIDSKVASNIQIIAGTGLSGGGNLSTNRTINLANTTVIPGSYTLSSFTVDAQGRITAAASGSVDLSSYVSLSGSYSDPSWITGLAWSKISSTPTSLSGYGISGVKTDFDSACTDGNFMYVGDAPTSHTHGNITNAGAIGSTSGLPIITTASGVLTTGSFGTTAGTFAEGNDSRITGALSAVTAASTYLPLIGGTLTGDLKFTDATYDIGKSGATRPRDGFFSRNVDVGGRINAAIGGTSIAYGFSSGGNSGISGYGGVSVIAAGNWSFHVNHVDVKIDGSLGFGFTGTLGDSTGSLDVVLRRDAADTLAQRRSTNAQTLRLYNTYTSTTSFENLQFKANAGGAYQIGSAIGSAGGTTRGIDIGGWDSSGTFSKWISAETDGRVRVGRTPLTESNASNLVVQPSSGIVSGDVTRISVIGNNSYQDVIFEKSNASNQMKTWAFGNRYDTYFGNTAGSFQITGIHTDGTIRVPLIAQPNGNLILVGATANATNGFLGINTISPTSLVHITQSVSTSGSPTALTLTGAAHTTLAASTEATDVNFNLARTVQFATGALTTQRAFRIQAPTYSFVGASTITTASTLSISGAPAAGTNATITNPYALNIESGNIGMSSTSYILTGGGTGYFYGRTGSANNWVGPGSAGVGLTSFGYFGGMKGEIGDGILMMTTAFGLGTSLSGYASTGADTLLCRDAAGIFAQRNGTNAQEFRIYTTYTSTTSYERLEIKGKSGANFEIGAENGSAGGTLRGITIGGYSAGSSTITPWITLTNTGAATFTISNSEVASIATGAVNLTSDTNMIFRLYAHGEISSGGIIQSYKARGADRNTKLYPAGSDNLIGFNVYGWDESSNNWSGAKATWSVSAPSTWTATSNGTQHTWTTTDAADATKTLTNRMRLQSNGNLTLGGITDTGGLFQIIGTNNAVTGFGTATNRLRFTDTDTTTATDQPIGEIEFYSSDASSPGAGVKASFLCAAESATPSACFKWGIDTTTGSLTNVMTLASSGLLTVTGGIVSSKVIRQNSEITYTPTGTTQTLTLNDGNHLTLNLTSATGTVTATLTVPTSSSSGTIIINQHASAAKGITWAVSSGTIKWMGTQPTWSSDAVSSVRIVSWRWNGSIMYLMSTDVGT